MASQRSRPDAKASPETGERWVALAVVARPHGIRGEVRLRPYNADSDLLLDVREVMLRKPGGEPKIVSFEHARRANDAILAKLPEVGDRNAAELLRDFEVLVRRSDFPPLEEDEFYVCDILGASVVGPEGAEIGRVEGLLSYPTAEVFVVAAEGGEKFEIPLADGFVDRVDVDTKKVFVTAEAAERAFE